MSELYRHLLIPNDAAFAPELDVIAGFFNRLKALDALPRDPKFVVVTNSGNTRAIAWNPSTGVRWTRRCGPVGARFKLEAGPF